MVLAEAPDEPRRELFRTTSLVPNMIRAKLRWGMKTSVRGARGYLYIVRRLRNKETLVIPERVNW